MAELLLADSVDLGPVIAEIATNGAASVPILREKARKRLLDDTEKYPYKTVVRDVEGVIQEADSFQDFQGDSLFLKLMFEFQQLIDKSLQPNEYPFRTALRFNTAYLLRYYPGSIGITPHEDSPMYVNLIVGFMLGGKAPFYVCDDEHKTNSREVDTTPGNVILMRAPGFILNNGKQFHFAGEVTEKRDGFWIRQDKYGGVY